MIAGNIFSAYADRTVLVTGASGFIGRWVARHLTAAGAQLHLTARDRSVAEALWAEYTVKGRTCTLDLQDSHVLVSLIKRLRPAVVFNLAGYGVDSTERDEALAVAINTHLVARLAEATVDHHDPEWTGLSLVHVGSALEYGTATGNLSEDGPTTPTTVYGRTKLAGTQALQSVARSRGLKAVTARLFTVYGPGEHSGRLLPSLLESAHSGEALPLTEGRQRRDFTYVEDVAEGLLRLGLSDAKQGDPGEPINLATGQLTTVRDFAQAAAAHLKLEPEQLGYGQVPTRTEEMSHDEVTTERLVRRTGWRPMIGIAEGVTRTAAWRDSGRTRGSA